MKKYNITSKIIITSILYLPFSYANAQNNTNQIPYLPEKIACVNINNNSINDSSDGTCQEGEIPINYPDTTGINLQQLGCNNQTMNQMIQQYKNNRRNQITNESKYGNQVIRGTPKQTTQGPLSCMEGIQKNLEKLGQKTQDIFKKYQNMGNFDLFDFAKNLAVKEITKAVNGVCREVNQQIGQASRVLNGADVNQICGHLSGTARSVCAQEVRDANAIGNSTVDSSGTGGLVNPNLATPGFNPNLGSTGTSGLVNPNTGGILTNRVQQPQQPRNNIFR